MDEFKEPLTPTQDRDAAFLIDLAKRLHRSATPATGFDQGDTDQLYRIARGLRHSPAPDKGDWQPIETAPFNRIVLIDDARFDEVCEAIQYCRDGWTTFGANGVFKCQPRAWRDKPAAPTYPLAHPAAQPSGDAVLREADEALLADGNGYYSQYQVDDMERNRSGALACKCGTYPRPSGDNARPDDGWRSMWCQGCMEHVVGWCQTEQQAVDEWNRIRSIELTTPPKRAALASPPVETGEGK
ncbi:hypothetical protein [Companilactobacillus sp.]|uniref:hypothetical protein n=1 Tax=Companilactobacillus sp. TaxID=2767905 RepID=UPI0026130976|nr:hypothetical protein [Companilactobacillus sp.]